MGTRSLRITLAVCGALGLPAMGPAALADETRGQHKHYEVPPEAAKPAPGGELAPRLQSLGDHVFPVTTVSKQAQLFVNQGVNLAYAFNHAEAARAFREAARLDPECAMAYWGEALVLGGNINAPMDPEDEPRALALAQKAVSLKGRVSPREQALIEAVAERYSGNKDERAARDVAYAAAMRNVRGRFPDDLDVATMYAEALMDLNPWGYWRPDGTPTENTLEIVSTLEFVLSRNEDHPGANHLYIHAVEATKDAGKAEAAADRLGELMPGAGHIVHMPGHIYIRVGRYADAASANQKAIAVDEDYITQCRAQGLYPMAYYPHNLHFLWWAATFDGRRELAVAAARKTAAQVTDDKLLALPLLAGFRVVPYFALTRFGMWDEMLKEMEPTRDNVFLNATWHYARGLALAGKGRLGEAEGELARVQAALPDPSLDAPMFSPNLARSILSIAPDVLGATIAAKRKEYDKAIALLDRAVRLEDGLAYTEPAEWHYPPRHALGAILLEAGRAKEAEIVYWQDLQRYPENGWALFGLAQAMAAQGRKNEAAAVEARFRKAWARADVTLIASRF
jgi:tetratricopeptide (TPR) repeat protein